MEDLTMHPGELSGVPVELTRRPEELSIEELVEKVKRLDQNREEIRRSADEQENGILEEIEGIRQILIERRAKLSELLDGSEPEEEVIELTPRRKSTRKKAARKKGRKGRLSEAGRLAISRAAKKRWAAKRKAQGR